MIIQFRATEHCFPVVLFIMLCKVILTFESVDETFKCDHSTDESPLISTFLRCCLFSSIFKNPILELCSVSTLHTVKAERVNILIFILLRC